MKTFLIWFASVWIYLCCFLLLIFLYVHFGIQCYMILHEINIMYLKPYYENELIFYIFKQTKKPKEKCTELLKVKGKVTLLSRLNNRGPRVNYCTQRENLWLFLFWKLTVSLCSHSFSLTLTLNPTLIFYMISSKKKVI